MTHALQLQQRNSLIFIPTRSLVDFLLRRKWVITLLILSALSIFTIPSFVSNTTAVQADAIETSVTPTLNDKIVAYMLNVNRNLDKETAYKLADAIIAARDEYHIPIDIQLGLITTESRFDQFAISNAGALGFYQIMPTVHNDKVKAMYESGEIDTKNIYDPMTQAFLGNRILHDCLRMYHHNWTRALQCYNGSTASTRYPTDVMKRAHDAKLVLATL